MILDNLLTFTGTSNGATGGITAGAQTDLPTTGTQAASNIIDLGVTSGVPSSANGGGAPGSYTTMWTSSAIAEASLVAGAQIANIDVPRPAPGQALPRYLKLNFISVGTHSAGAIECGIVLDRDDQILGSGGVYSGYPAGLTVSN